MLDRVLPGAAGQPEKAPGQISAGASDRDRSPAGQIGTALIQQAGQVSMPRLGKGGRRTVLAILLGDGGPVCLPYECLDRASAHAAVNPFLLFLL